MFDGLQEGVIVVDKNSIGFMNELSNKLLSELSGLRNFFKNKPHQGSKNDVHPMDMQLFYLFE